MNMAKAVAARRYTAAQLSDAERMAAAIANVPEDKKAITVMMLNSFMAGMEAQKALDNTGDPATV